MRIRFGPYELNDSRMELRKDGTLVRLQEQPFRVLACLVKDPGQIVTRDELRQKIWDNGTFVDFDQSLNKAVNRLRETLNDDVTRPKYIETVPRRGYRFLAHVEQVDAPSNVQPTLPEPGKTKGHSSRRVTYALSLGVIAVVIVAAILLLRTSGHRDDKPPRVVVRDAFFPSISRDGQMLAYLSTVGGDLPHVSVQQTTAEKSMQVTSGPVRDFAVDLSRDGTYILVSRDRKAGGVSVRSVFPGEPKLVLPSATWGRFSSDGQTILGFADGEVFIASVKTGEVTKLPFANRDYQLDSLPLWAASAKAFVFLGRRKGEPLSLNRWCIADLVTHTVRELAIPNLGQPKNVLPWFQGWMRRDGRNSLIIWSVQDQDVWRLYAVRVDDRGEPSGKQLLASGNNIIADTSLAYHFTTGPASMSDAGRLLYTLTSVTEQIFQLPTDASGRQRGPLAEVPLRENALYYSPSVSADGHTLAYIEGETGNNSRLTVRDLLSGNERVLHESTRDPRNGSASLSRDGSKVVFNSWCDEGPRPDCPSFLIPSDGGRPEQLCTNCQARGFNADSSLVLMQKYKGDTPGKKRDRIVAFDLGSRKEQELLYDDEHPVYHPFFSPDDRWIVFKRLLTMTKSQLVIAPYRRGHAVPVSDWIEITDGKFSDDKPQFSSDGNIVYFTSDRDGYLCIWSQRLHPVTKRPVGDPVAYEHFHNSMGRDGASYPQIQWMSDLTVGADRMLINLQQRRHDIWTVQVK